MVGYNRHLLKRKVMDDPPQEQFPVMANDSRDELQRIIDTYKITKSKVKFRLFFSEYLQRYKDLD